MNNKRVYIFSLLLGLSLISLLWIQFLWINNAVKLSKKEFDTDVRKSLTLIGAELEDNSYCVNFQSSGLIPANQTISLTRTFDSLSKDTIPFYYNYRREDFDTTFRYSDISFNYPIEIQNNLRVTFLIDDSTDLPENIDDTLTGFQRTFDPNIDLVLLDSLLKREFSTLLTDAKYDYALQNRETGAFIYKSDNSLGFVSNENCFEQKIFVDDGFRTTHSIFVIFPDKNMIIWKSLWFVIISSIVLLIVLIFLFISFLKILYGQKKLNEMRMDFINTMTHEFKTPVSNITLAVKALKDKYKQPQDQKYLEIIAEEKDRLHEGIDLVLTSALIEKQQLSLNKTSVDIDALIRQTVKNSALKIREKKANIELDLSTEGLSITLDKHHFTNVLDNMLNNALNYSEDFVHILVSSKIQDGFLEIVFKDTGHGIASEDLRYIFDKFYRISTQDRYENKGFGIGLYYVKKIVEAHEGTITVESTLRVGTKFTIHLPV